MWIGLIILAVVLLIILYAVSIYNSLIRYSKLTDEGASQIDVQLKKRNDLLPNLIATVKGSTKHERETLESLVNLRNKLSAINFSENPDESMQLSSQLSTQLKSVFALAEAYPDLKASQNFLRLQEDLVNIENKIAYARQNYNNVVFHYNTLCCTVPSLIVAKLFGFKERTYLKIAEEEKAVPKVEF